jgi:hypothetical protein
MAAPDAVRFRQAAVALSMASMAQSEDVARERAEEAAGALVDLARDGDEDALRAILRPDPGQETVTWTVACYGIGDLAPSALRDFADAAAAVTTLAGCGELTHVAAELLASTPTGLTWTALTRTGDQTTFHPFGRSAMGEVPASSPAPVSSDDATLAALRWQTQLSGWAARREDPAPVPVRARETGAQAQARGGGAAARDVLRRLAFLEQQVEQLREQVQHLEGRLAEHEPPEPAPPWSAGASHEVAP